MHIRRCVPALSALPILLSWNPVAAQVALPDQVSGWKAAGPAQTYDPKTVYDYMDGAAEVYLSYGMRAMTAQVYEKQGEPSITLNVFTMDRPEGAFGVFTYERVDGEAGIGQGSEYGPGMLRCWQGSTFVFIQAMQETPAVKSAILDLGRSLMKGDKAPVPPLAGVLPQEALRPLTVRYVLGRQLIEAMETLAMDNALGLPVRCEAVMGRYGQAGKGERIFVIRYPDAEAANRGVTGFLKGGKLGEPQAMGALWRLGACHDRYAVLVLDAASKEVAMKRMTETQTRLKEVMK